MQIQDVICWQDRQTPALAVSKDGGICYLDNASPNYGKPMYHCTYRGSFAAFSSFDSALAWFDWIKTAHMESGL